MFQLTKIERRPSDQGFVFVAILSDGDLPFRLNVAPIHLLSYMSMQEYVLGETGRMLMHFHSEGRQYIDADRVWRMHIDAVLIDAPDQSVSTKEIQ